MRFSTIYFSCAQYLHVWQEACPEGVAPWVLASKQGCSATRFKDASVVAVGRWSLDDLVSSYFAWRTLTYHESNDRTHPPRAHAHQSPPNSPSLPQLSSSHPCSTHTTSSTSTNPLSRVYTFGINAENHDNLTTRTVGVIAEMPYPARHCHAMLPPFQHPVIQDAHPRRISPTPGFCFLDSTPSPPLILSSHSTPTLLPHSSRATSPRLPHGSSTLSLAVSPKHQAQLSCSNRHDEPRPAQGQSGTQR